jgi:hypothetical protein
LDQGQTPWTISTWITRPLTFFGTRKDVFLVLKHFSKISYNNLSWGVSCFDPWALFSPLKYHPFEPRPYFIPWLSK